MCHPHLHFPRTLASRNPPPPPLPPHSHSHYHQRSSPNLARRLTNSTPRPLSERNGSHPDLIRLWCHLVAATAVIELNCVKNGLSYYSRYLLHHSIEVSIQLVILDYIWRTAFNYGDMIVVATS